MSKKLIYSATYIFAVVFGIFINFADIFIEVFIEIVGDFETNIWCK